MLTTLISCDESCEEIQINELIHHNLESYNHNLNRDHRQNEFQLTSLELGAKPEETKEAFAAFELNGFEQRIKDYLKNYHVYEQIQIEFDEIKIMHSEEYIKDEANSNEDSPERKKEDKQIQVMKQSNSLISLELINQLWARVQNMHLENEEKNVQIIQLQEKINQQEKLISDLFVNYIFQGNLNSNHAIEIEILNKKIKDLHQEIQILQGLTFSSQQKNTDINNDDFKNLSYKNNPILFDIANKIEKRKSIILQSQQMIQNLIKQFTFWQTRIKPQSRYFKNHTYSIHIQSDQKRKVHQKNQSLDFKNGQ